MGTGLAPGVAAGEPVAGGGRLGVRTGLRDPVGTGVLVGTAGTTGMNVAAGAACTDQIGLLKTPSSHRLIRCVPTLGQ